MKLYIDNISKSFNRTNSLNWRTPSKKILKNISIEANNGDVIGVIGSNGSGKSTLLKVIMGLISTDSGSIYINNKAQDYSQKINKYAHCFNNNDRSFFWRLTVKENIDFFKNLDISYTSTKRSNEIFHLLDIGDIYNSRFDTLSSGERKRVSLYRGLIKDPNIMLFDEFTDSLDISVKAKIIKRVKNLSTYKENKIIFWVTHSFDELRELCNRVILLDKGSLVKDIKLQDINDNVIDNLNAQLLRKAQ